MDQAKAMTTVPTDTASARPNARPVADLEAISLASVVIRRLVTLHAEHVQLHRVARAIRATASDFDSLPREKQRRLEVIGRRLSQVPRTASAVLRAACEMNLPLNYPPQLTNHLKGTEE